LRRKPGYPLQFLSPPWRTPAAGLRDFRFYPLRSGFLSNYGLIKVKLQQTILLFFRLSACEPKVRQNCEFQGCFPKTSVLGKPRKFTVLGLRQTPRRIEAVKAV
jgi:hypothetical protein